MLANMANKTRHFAACGRSDVKLRCSFPRVRSVLGSMIDKNISPVGWYVASYVLRFVELERTDIENPDARFLTWVNSILVRASDLDEAYDKTVVFALQNTEPYKGGKDGVPVQWVFEGVTEILPIYEELQDGAEIMWAERNPRKLSNIRNSVRKKGQFKQ